MNRTFSEHAAAVDVNSSCSLAVQQQQHHYHCLTRRNYSVELNRVLQLRIAHHGMVDGTRESQWSGRVAPLRTPQHSSLDRETCSCVPAGDHVHTTRIRPQSQVCPGAILSYLAYFRLLVVDCDMFRSTYPGSFSRLLHEIVHRRSSLALTSSVVRCFYRSCSIKSSTTYSVA